MKNAKWWMKVWTVVAVSLWAQGAGAAEVRNVTAEYAWPWGVEIRYELTGTVSGDPLVIITATDRANNATYTVQASALSGDTGTQTGVHKVLWDLDKHGIQLQSTNVVFTVAYEKSSGLYCVVDLSGGADAASYPVRYMDNPPSGGFNTDAYKTTKLVLRRIPAGSYTMGSPSSESGPDSYESQHKVTLTKPFYIGLFEVTQKQWALVMGSNPSSFTGDMRPVECVSYEAIRGSSSGRNWPAGNAVDASSFLGKVRAKTGVEFDLPTEAQWEYACRAGTTSSYNNRGSTTNDLNKLGRYYYNGGSSNQHAKVGSYKPNAWGLYDMHGNVDEWCLDWYVLNLGTAAVTDPKGASSGWGRVFRGGSWNDSAAYCRSAYRDYSHQHYSYDYKGFRLSRTLEVE